MSDLDKLKATNAELLASLKMLVRWHDEDAGDNFLEDALLLAERAIKRAGEGGA